MKKKIKDKWGKKQIFVINAIPYKQDIIVGINTDFKGIVKFLKKVGNKQAQQNVEYIENNLKDEKGLEGDSQGVTYPNMPIGFMVLLKHLDDWSDTVAVVSHECLHLTHYIARNAGLTLSQESEEAYTYLQAYLLREIIKKMY